MVGCSLESLEPRDWPRAGRGRACRPGAARRRRFARRLAPGPWSHFWSHPPVFGRVQPAPAVTHRHWPGRWRIIVNGSKQNWKACWWQRLASSNLASSAAVTRQCAWRARTLPLIAGGCWSQFWSRKPGLTGVDQGIHSLQLNHDGLLLHLLAAPLPSRAFRSPPPTVGSYRSPNICALPVRGLAYR
jgi:hypothetical protein